MTTIEWPWFALTCVKILTLFLFGPPTYSVVVILLEAVVLGTTESLEPTDGVRPTDNRPS